MSRWFRHYAGMMRDDKLVRVALRSKQSIERVIWVWGAILESAAEINDNGKYDLDAGEVAYFLRSDEADISSILSALADAGRVVDGVVVNWSARQFQSDRSAPRQAAYRERKRSQGGDADNALASGDVTTSSPSQQGDSPELELDTELEAEAKNQEQVPSLRSGALPSNSSSEESKVSALKNARAREIIECFELRFWPAYPKRDGANPKTPAQKAFIAAVKSGAKPEDIIAGAERYRSGLRGKGQEGTVYVAQAVTWLHQSRWKDYPEAQAADAASEAKAGFWAAPDSLELDAWDEHSLSTRGRRYPRDKRNGWTVPSRWPPNYQPRGSPQPTGSAAQN